MHSERRGGHFYRCLSVDAQHSDAVDAPFGGVVRCRPAPCGRRRRRWHIADVHILAINLAKRSFSLRRLAREVGATPKRRALRQYDTALRVRANLLRDMSHERVPCLNADRRAFGGAVIPGRSNRRRTIRYDEQRYRSRHLIENAFSRLKDFRRVHTRYHKLAAHFLSAVALATAVAF